MEYECVDAESASDLDRQVTNMLLLGWRLQGGVSVAMSESDDYRHVIFAQAMIKGE